MTIAISQILIKHPQTFKKEQLNKKSNKN